MSRGGDGAGGLVARDRGVNGGGGRCASVCRRVRICGEAGGDGVHGDDVLLQLPGVGTGDVVDAGAGVLRAEQDADRAGEVVDLEVVPALLARAEGDGFVAESGAKHGVHEARFMVAAAVHAVDAHVDELHRRVVVDFREETLLGRPAAETELCLPVGAHRHGHAMIADAVLGLGAGEEELPRTEQLRVEVGLLRILDVLDLDVRVAATRGADAVPREVDPRVNEGRGTVGQCRRRQAGGFLRCSSGRRRAGMPGRLGAAGRGRHSLYGGCRAGMTGRLRAVGRGRRDLHGCCRARMPGRLGAAGRVRRAIEAQHLRVVRFAELSFRKRTQVEMDGPVRRVRADAMRVELLRAPAARAHCADDLMALLKQKLRCI